VFTCRFTCESGTMICVDKLQKVFNNEEICKQKFQEMYKEFRIGCSLDHPNIVKYHYFLRCNS